MVVERGLGLSGASARDGEVSADILEFESERDSARGNLRGGKQRRVSERVEGGAAHRAAVLFGNLEVTAAARIDVAGRALEKNRNRPLAAGGGARAFDFVHRKARPIARVEQVVLA